MVMIRFKYLVSQNHCWWVLRGKNNGEPSKMTWKVSVLIHWQDQSHSKWPSGCKEFQRPAVIENILPNPLFTIALTAVSSCQSFERYCIWIVISSKLEPIFCMQEFHFKILNCSSQIILRSDKTHQDSWQQTFDRHIILHLTLIGVKIFSFSTFWLNAHPAGQWGHHSQKSKNWDLEIWDSSMVSNMVDFFHEQIV